MPTYYTVQHLAEMFHRDDKTIRRWIDEGREICFDGRVYVPQKDPGGAWLFVVHVAQTKNDGAMVVSVRRRRVLSSGIK